MEQNLDIEKIIRGYLPQVVHMSLATCVDNKPWVCEVHFAYDDDLNLYFGSAIDRRHCEEIRNNPNVAGNIVTQHHLNQKGRGVYFEGTAEQIEDISETHPAFVAYSGRFKVSPHAVESAKGKGKARYYKISVENYYLYDGYESNPPQKYQLPWGKNRSVTDTK